MDRDTFRVGLIVPSSNTVMEPDMHRHLGNTCAVSTSRTLLRQATTEDETRMVREELPRSIQLIATTEPHVTVFGCTSAGALGGVDHDLEIGRNIERGTGGKGVTVVRSVLGQFEKLRVRRLAVFTPYVEELTESVTGCFRESGYELVKVAGMGIVENRDIGEVTPSAIEEFVSGHMDGTTPDCIFLSCTNWQAIDAIEPLRKRFGVPVISSNQATIEAVREAVANLAS
jgi:maleate isomerase